MSDPTLKTFSVTIKYASSDGYSVETQFAGGGKRSATAEQALLSAIDEVARLAALFGIQEQADKMVDEAIQRVAEWRADR